MTVERHWPKEVLIRSVFFLAACFVIVVLLPFVVTQIGLLAGYTLAGVAVIFAASFALVLKVGGRAPHGSNSGFGIQSKPTGADDVTEAND